MRMLSITPYFAWQIFVAKCGSNIIEIEELAFVVCRADSYSCACQLPDPKSQDKAGKCKR